MPVDPPSAIITGPAVAGPAVTGPAVTGLILAGGRGRRLGGIDKGLAQLDGRPLVAHVAQRLRPQVGRLLVGANRSHADYAALGLDVVGDPPLDGVEPYPGPLAGMLAGLAAIDDGWLCCAPCDAPFLPPDYVARLYAAATAGKAWAAVARCGRMQPVFVLLHAGLRDALADALIVGVRRVEHWLSDLRPAQADFDDCPRAFVNLNTAADWTAAQKL